MCIIASIFALTCIINIIYENYTYSDGGQAHGDHRLAVHVYAFTVQFVTVTVNVPVPAPSPANCGEELAVGDGNAGSGAGARPYYVPGCM